MTKKKEFKVMDAKNNFAPAPSFEGWFPIGLDAKCREGDVYICPLCGGTTYLDPDHPHKTIMASILKSGCKTASGCGYESLYWMVYRRLTPKVFSAWKAKFVTAPKIEGYRALAWDEPAREHDQFFQPCASAAGVFKKPVCPVADFNWGKTCLQMYGGKDGMKSGFLVYRPLNPPQETKKTVATWSKIVGLGEICKYGDVMIKKRSSSPFIAETQYQCEKFNKGSGHGDAFMITGFAGRSLGRLRDKDGYTGYELWRRFTIEIDKPKLILKGNKIYSKELTLP